MKTAEEVVVVARRGPFEAKFDKKEFDYIEEFLDRKAFDEELRRIQPQLSAIGQDISKLAEETFPVLATPATGIRKAKPVCASASYARRRPSMPTPTAALTGLLSPKMFFLSATAALPAKPRINQPILMWIP